MRDEIILSLIIPIYNSETYLKECLNSIICCKNKNIEIILIDDGSTDKSHEICDKYHKTDKRIKLIHQENSGVSSARNNGINLAQGKYLMFVDSDDVLDENWEFTLTKLKNDDIYYFSEKLNNKVNKNQMLKYIVGYNEEKICFAGPFSKIFKKELLIKNQILFNKNLINGEDMLFNATALLKCKSFKIINKSFYNYRNLQGSATKRFNEKIITSDITFHNELKILFKNSDINQELINEICLYCIQTAIIIILYRMSYIKKYKDTKKYYKLLLQKPYLLALNSKKIVNKKHRIIIYLLKIKQQKIIYYTLKIFNTIKFKKNKGFYFSKI